MNSCVDVAVLDQQVQQAVQQRQIGAGLDLQEQVGLVGGGGAARVDHDQLGAGLEPVGHPQEQDRMAVGHVRADDEEQVGVSRSRCTSPGGPSAPSDCL